MATLPDVSIPPRPTDGTPRRHGPASTLLRLRHTTTFSLDIDGLLLPELPAAILGRRNLTAERLGEMPAETIERGRPGKGNAMLPLLSDLGISKMLWPTSYRRISTAATWHPLSLVLWQARRGSSTTRRPRKGRRREVAETIRQMQAKRLCPKEHKRSRLHNLLLPSKLARP